MVKELLPTLRRPAKQIFNAPVRSLAVGVFDFVFFGQVLEQGFEELGETTALLNAHRDGAAHAEAFEVVHFDVHFGSSSLLTARVTRSLCGRSTTGNVLVEVGDVAAAIDEEDDVVSGADGAIDLLLDVGFEFGVVDDADTAGVDQVKTQVVPTALRAGRGRASRRQWGQQC